MSSFSQTNYFYLSQINIVTNVINFYTKYEKLAFPFHNHVWLALGIICAFSSLLICICGGRRQWQGYRHFLIGSANKTPHFYMYTLAVGANMTTTHMPKRNFARFLLTCWLLATLILRSAYQSGMYQMLRENKQWNPPNTIENVFERNYLISLTPENRRYLAVLPDVKRLKVFNATIMSAFNEMLAVSEPLAFITPHEYFGYLSKVNASQWQRLHLVKERILTQQLTIYVRHNSYLINVLNNQIAEAQFYGFINLWNRRYTQPLVTGKVNLQTEEVGLSMRELGAIFIILIWLHGFATFVFLIEFLWHHYGYSMKKRLFGID